MLAPPIRRWIQLAIVVGIISVPSPTLAAQPSGGGGYGGGTPPSVHYVAGEPDSLADSIARSTLFGLIAGLASIGGLLVALWHTQVRHIPYSLYRALVWRQMLLFSIGCGFIFGSAVAVLSRSEPLLWTLMLPVFWLSGERPPIPLEESYMSTVSTACLSWILGGLLAGLAVYRSPIPILRRTLTRERAAIQEARQAQLKELFQDKAFEQLGPADRALYVEVVEYYADVQARMLDILLGQARTLRYRPSVLRRTEEAAGQS